MGRSRGAVLITELHDLEIANAVQLRVFRGELDPPEAAAAQATFAADRREGRFTPAPVPSTAFLTAARVAVTHTAQFGVRSLDILHLAIALELQADQFYSFDRKQLRLAQALGLRLA